MYTHEVSPARLLKHELNQDNNSQVKAEEEKAHNASTLCKELQVTWIYVFK